MGKWRGRQIGRRWSGAFLLILLVSLVSLLPIRAQEAGGTILGVVTDPSGAAVANANVSIKNVATGVERSVPTNDDGVYVAPNLVPGGYEVRIDAAGFSPPGFVHNGVTVGGPPPINVSPHFPPATAKRPTCTPCNSLLHAP